MLTRNFIWFQNANQENKSQGTYVGFRMLTSPFVPALIFVLLLVSVLGELKKTMLDVIRFYCQFGLLTSLPLSPIGLSVYL